jgi:hypothetical protein
MNHYEESSLLLLSLCEVKDKKVGIFKKENNLYWLHKVLLQIWLETAGRNRTKNSSGPRDSLDNSLGVSLHWVNLLSAYLPI